jgi:cytoskeletal protein RodZ
LALRREKKGITLEQISGATKIGVRSLRAIEGGEFDKLPGGIYSTNYIRQYARLVDADETELLDEYYAKMGIPAPNGFGQASEPARKPVTSQFRQTSAAVNS